MAEPYIGEIRMFGGNWAPRDWAMCDGQIVDIFQNESLYCLLGTYYGGDGMSNFALPDMRGRAPVHHGHGVGLTPRSLGQRTGVELVTLTPEQVPDGTPSGDGQPHWNLQPYTAVTFIISLDGNFPQRY